MEYRRGIMKISLAENLRALMVKMLFDKITIKRICDETGVIRATFYNYFEDKYDCLNYIAHHDIVENNIMKFNKGDIFGCIEDILIMIDNNRPFYKAAYNNVTGQNSFEDMVREQFKDLEMRYLEAHRKPTFLAKYDNEVLARYYAESFAYIFKMYVFQEYSYSKDEVMKLIKDLLEHSFIDFVNQVSK